MLIFLLFSSCLAQNDPVHTAIIYGSSDLGYYYVNLYVGTPPQKQSVIVDTASHITTFPCSTCPRCGKHIDQSFNQKSSSTIVSVDCNSQLGLLKCAQCDKNRKCVYQISYAEGSSLSGYFFIDMILFGDELYELYRNNKELELVQAEQVPSVIGCTESETNLFFSQDANGIMGLSPLTNVSSYPNLVDALYEKEAKNNLKQMFTLCIGRQNGYMAIGNYDTARHLTNQTYRIPYYVYDPHSVYNIIVKGIRVNGNMIGVEGDLNRGQGTFIDSGSTLANIYPELAGRFAQHFTCNSDQCPVSVTSQGLKCYKYEKQLYQTFEEYAKLFPTFEFELENNFTFSWTAIDYLYKDPNTNDLYCLPVYPYGGSSRMILGQVWMRNWDIAFDKENRQLTFAKSKCSDTKVSHNFTEEEIYAIEQTSSNLNGSILKPRPPRVIEQDPEVIMVFSILCGMVLFVLILYIWKRRCLIQSQQYQKPTRQLDESGQEDAPV